MRRAFEFRGNLRGVEAAEDEKPGTSFGGDALSSRQPDLAGDLPDDNFRFTIAGRNLQPWTIVDWKTDSQRDAAGCLARIDLARGTRFTYVRLSQ